MRYEQRKLGARIIWLLSEAMGACHFSRALHKPSEEADCVRHRRSYIKSPTNDQKIIARIKIWSQMHELIRLDLI